MRAIEGGGNMQILLDSSRQLNWIKIVNSNRRRLIWIFDKNPDFKSSVPGAI